MVLQHDPQRGEISLIGPPGPAPVRGPVQAVPERPDEIAVLEQQDELTEARDPTLRALRRIRARIERLTARINELIRVTVEPPRRRPGENVDEWSVRRVRVVTAGTPVQGPDFVIPDGFVCAIRQRRHTGTPIGYIGPSSGSTLGTDTRVELRDAESVSLNISNMKKVWFNADTANTDFEMMVEL